ncbi:MULTISPECIES: hypothetical protein [unclassified Ruegeria]|uniref:hypothetical protein n=1 Tax=unclassified Ruegeria TaxID=2625375 RepID=UPI001491AA03|nr:MULTISPECIES: hypothetical protein [unclassified Ruegeria]NOD46451.1 hypothetical protein [Ruegeria sp. HKCCD5849]NOD50249.1 hypothetical protein [Ruegeria sp. HKCCD5851]NOD67084.1 hypothetical protein [Ruegeria sp. HKCCD7303]
MTFLVASEFVRVFGISYVAGLVITTSGIFPGFGKTIFSKLKYAEAEARIRRQKLGWGAPEAPDKEVSTKQVLRMLPVTVLLIGLTIYGFRWVENAQIPALNFLLGSASLVMGLFLRRQFLRDWYGSRLKLDFACFLIGLFFYLQQI